MRKKNKLEKKYLFILCVCELVDWPIEIRKGLRIVHFIFSSIWLVPIFIYSKFFSSIFKKKKDAAIATRKFTHDMRPLTTTNTSIQVSRAISSKTNRTCPFTMWTEPKKQATQTQQIVVVTQTQTRSLIVPRAVPPQPPPTAATITVTITIPLPRHNPQPTTMKLNTINTV